MKRFIILMLVMFIAILSIGCKATITGPVNDRGEPIIHKGMRPSNLPILSKEPLLP